MLTQILKLTQVLFGNHKWNFLTILKLAPFKNIHLIIGTIIYNDVNHWVLSIQS